MNVTIRPARPDEVAGLAAIERTAGNLFPPGRIPDSEDVYPVTLLEQACAEALLFVAELDGTVVGFATCTPIAGRLHLDELSVHPDHGRQGLGRRLVQRAIDAARERALSGVSLTTFADIPWNGPFYLKMGFRQMQEDELDDPLITTLAHERKLGLTERIAMYRPGQEEA